ncbi:hypothetical protein J3F84DRAFT_358356 [Trichoderma pleuroticola]
MPSQGDRIELGNPVSRSVVIRQYYCNCTDKVAEVQSASTNGTVVAWISINNGHNWRSKQAASCFSSTGPLPRGPMCAIISDSSSTGTYLDIQYRYKYRGQATRREFHPLSPPHQTRRNLSTNRFLSPATVQYIPHLLHFHMMRTHFACWFRGKAAFGQFQARCSMLTRCPQETDGENKHYTSNVAQQAIPRGDWPSNFSIQCAVPRTQRYESGKKEDPGKQGGCANQYSYCALPPDSY